MAKKIDYRKNNPLDFRYVENFWSLREIVSHIQRRILVYSFMYYELNDSLVSDMYFDSLCEQYLYYTDLIGLEITGTNYYKAFIGFDGSTGFDLLSKLDKEQKEHIEKIAYGVLNGYEKKNG